MKKSKNFLIALLFLVLISCQKTESKPLENEQAGGERPQMTRVSISAPVNPATELVRNMGIGVNIGNTLDAIGNTQWVAGETGWGNPPITREYIRALKNYGYTTIRLPVTWAEYIGPGPDFFIEESRMSRVEEVVKWILGEGLYCIVNLHHDGGESDRSWILNAANDPDGVAKQLRAVWGQIARRFSGVSQDKLIFESMNEVGFDKLWNRYGGGINGKSEAFRILNLLNQTFVDTVRGTAGNDDRFLLIAGYWTDINQTCDPLFLMPEDTKEDRLILSVHYYDPSTFTIAEQPDNSGGFSDDWGTDADYAGLTTQFNKLKTNFIERGIPVILGEYGVTFRNKVEAGRVRWMSAVMQTSLDYGICPVLWETGGDIRRNPPYPMSPALTAVWDQFRGE
jgi:endoglucanase